MLGELVSLAIWPLFSVTQVQLPELNKSTSLDGFTLVLAENCHLTKHLQLVPSLPVVCICFTCQEYFYFLQRPMMASLINEIKWLWQDDHMYHMTSVHWSLSYSQEQLPELNNSTSLDEFKLVLLTVSQLIKQLQLVPYLQLVCICSPCNEKLYFLMSQMKASLINENCEREEEKNFPWGGYTWIVIYFFCFAVDSTDNWGGVGWVAVHFNHYQS